MKRSKNAHLFALMRCFTCSFCNRFARCVCRRDGWLCFSCQVKMESLEINMTSPSIWASWLTFVLVQLRSYFFEMTTTDAINLHDNRRQDQWIYNRQIHIVCNSQKMECVCYWRCVSAFIIPHHHATKHASPCRIQTACAILTSSPSALSAGPGTNFILWRR